MPFNSLALGASKASHAKISYVGSVLIPIEVICLYHIHNVNEETDVQRAEVSQLPQAHPAPDSRKNGT